MREIFKILTILLLLVHSALADETGSASIFSFHDGVALQNNEVLVDGEYKHFTDEDGSVELILEVGKHQIEIFAKDENAQNLGYAKKSIEIKESRDTQLIATFKEQSSSAYIEVDTPLGTSDRALDESLVMGRLQGLILSSETNKPIESARIFVKGSAIEGVSDANGEFSLDIPIQRELSISVVHSEYSAQTINKIILQKDKTLKKEIRLTPASMELEEFIVLAPKVEGSIASLVSETKNASSISNIIGSEQMSKQGDSNAAAALKRVAGVTVMGGKYIYVRGLGDRYSATELNGLALPSPNPIKRTVPLDMFPSGVIGSLQVQKSASSDITAAFGGGYVNIRTKEKFSDDYAKLKVGVEAHSSYGEDVISSQAGADDWSGKDDGTRAFSSSFVSSITPEIGKEEPIMTQSPTQMQEIISQRSYNHQKSTLPLGKDIAIEFAKKITLADEHEFYLLGDYGYKTRSKNINYIDYDYILSSSGVQSEAPDNIATTARNVTTIQHGGMLNLGYKYRTLELKLLKLYVLNTLNQSRFSEGTFGENNSAEKQTYFEWQERELDTNQFTGGFDYRVVLPNRFDFALEYATATEYVPNDVEYSYLKSTAQDAPYEFTRNQSILSFLNRTTDDSVKSYSIKNRTSIPLLSDDDYLELGVSNETKDRESRVNRVEMRSKIVDESITAAPIDGVVNYSEPEDALRFDLVSLPKESFNASLKRDAYYLKTLLKPSEKFDITLGLRHVSLNQSIDQFAVVDDTITTQENSLSFEKTLPSLALKYAFNNSNQLKFSYSETFVYPDFREFSNTEFIHPIFIAKVAGNPDLVESDIANYDLQYGYYFDDMDNITASLFYKKINNPIEDVRTFTTSTLDRFSFENSSQADLMGLELSWYKNLGSLHRYAKRFTIFGNYTYIDSTVTLTEEQKEKFVTTQRGLQGLSPEVINLSLLYQDKERSLNLAYNKMSKRLMRVALKNGDVILGLDDYEEPPHLLDFTWIEKFNWDAADTEFEMTLKIKNILDSETVWTQKEKTTLKYKEGTSYSLSFSAKI